MKPVLLVIAGPNGAYVYDNSVDGEDARLCARTESGFLRKVYGALPQWVDDCLAAVVRHADFVDLRPT